MGRYTFPAFNKAPTPRYVVLWDLHWHVIECQRLEPAADLSGAIAATITRLAADRRLSAGLSTCSVAWTSAALSSPGGNIIRS